MTKTDIVDYLYTLAEDIYEGRVSIKSFREDVDYDNMWPAIEYTRFTIDTVRKLEDVKDKYEGKDLL